MATRIQVKLDGSIQYEAVAGNTVTSTAVIDVQGNRYVLLQSLAQGLQAWTGDSSTDPVPCELVNVFGNPEVDRALNINDLNTRRLELTQRRARFNTGIRSCHASPDTLREWADARDRCSAEIRRIDARLAEVNSHTL